MDLFSASKVRGDEGRRVLELAFGLAIPQCFAEWSELISSLLCSCETLGHFLTCTEGLSLALQSFCPDFKQCLVYGGVCVNYRDILFKCRWWLFGDFFFVGYLFLHWCVSTLVIRVVTYISVSLASCVKCLAHSSWHLDIWMFRVGTKQISTPVILLTLHFK